MAATKQADSQAAGTTHTGGSLSILNVGAGDIHITFETGDPDEVRNAVSMLLDMQKRGYAILVAMPDGTYARAQSIDGQRGDYIVRTNNDTSEPGPGSLPGDDQPKKRSGRRSRDVRLPVTGTRAVGVARSAGG